MMATYLAIKREEIAHVANLSPAEICAAYRDVY